jgi:site-specific DNA-methyltransferase (adenine-specific)
MKMFDNNERVWLMQGDCLERMKEIPSGSVDMVLTDPPYQTTACKWDTIIPFEPMWLELKRIIKPNGAIVLFGQEPFSSFLRMSNIKDYKYDWIWDKVKPGAFATAKYAPLKQHELVSVFYSQAGRYSPQMVKRERVKRSKIYASSDSALVKYNDGLERTYDELYPKSIIVESNANQKGKVHPTQKPVALMEYLIKTYTNEDEIVLDFAFGSGTTGVAARNTNRKFIGIELDSDYFRIALERIAQ